MLSKRHLNVLRRLNEADKPVPIWWLPNGHGHCLSATGTFASNATMAELEDLRLVSYSATGYLITVAGRDALQEKEAGE